MIKSKIEGYGGTCNIQKAPKVVTAMDDADLAKQLERAELENAEVSGYTLQGFLRMREARLFPVPWLFYGSYKNLPSKYLVPVFRRRF